MNQEQPSTLIIGEEHEGMVWVLNGDTGERLFKASFNMFNHNAKEAKAVIKEMVRLYNEP